MITNNNYSAGLIITVLLWFFAASALIYYMSTKLLVEFDPNMTLSSAITSLSFEQDLVASLTHTEYLASTRNDKNVPDNMLGAADLTQHPATIFHFTQGNCYCEYVASSHQSRLKQWSSEQGFININIDLNNYPALTNFIPSTPAVAVLGQHNQLMYLGPYSRGTGCFASSGEVDDFLADWIAKQNTQMTQQRPAQYTQNAIIDTDATGCYCAS